MQRLAIPITVLMVSAVIWGIIVFILWGDGVTQGGLGTFPRRPSDKQPAPTQVEPAVEALPALPLEPPVEPLPALPLEPPVNPPAAVQVEPPVTDAILPIEEDVFVVGPIPPGDGSHDGPDSGDDAPDSGNDAPDSGDDAPDSGD